MSDTSAHAAALADPLRVLCRFSGACLTLAGLVVFLLAMLAGPTDNGEVTVRCPSIAAGGTDYRVESDGKEVDFREWQRGLEGFEAQKYTVEWVDDVCDDAQDGKRSTALWAVLAVAFGLALFVRGAKPWGASTEASSSGARPSTVRSDDGGSRTS